MLEHVDVHPCKYKGAGRLTGERSVLVVFTSYSNLIVSEIQLQPQLALADMI